MIERLAAATSRPIVIDSQQFCVHVTIGIAISDRETSSLEELIRLADRDMYAAKQA